MACKVLRPLNFESDTTNYLVFSTLSVITSFITHDSYVTGPNYYLIY